MWRFERPNILITPANRRFKLQEERWGGTWCDPQHHDLPEICAMLNEALDARIAGKDRSSPAKIMRGRD